MIRLWQSGGIIAGLMILCVLSSCKKEERVEHWAVIQLYRESSGLPIQISECMLDGNKVYSAVALVDDGVAAIYDRDGKLMVVCDPQVPFIDRKCLQLYQCEVVYRSAENSRGWPGVDKYGVEAMK